ncbi:MAG TPA: efflux RND transporter permease subunit [Candidatus Avilachnospira avistercoris]|nr:efflux RND transporter permease subunit [Candidatus Avilachnospira avistercoris]
MTNLSKLVLKRPVTTLLGVLCLIFFGVLAIFNSRLELTPEISMPMLIVTTTYAGAAPEDIDELITQPIEEEVSTLSNIDTMTSQSSDNYSMVLLQYEYGTDMDNAYSDLRKRLDLVRSSLPEDASDPTIIEMDINQVASIYLSINVDGINNIYNYTDKEIVPEFEKLSSVASVDLSGGSEEYISISLIPEKLEQYRLDMTTVASLVGAASFSMPAGQTGVGSTELNISSGVEYLTPEELENIPITAGGGNIIYLKDIAVVSRTEEDPEAVGRYNGDDTILLSINRNQRYTAVDVSEQVNEAIAKITAQNPNVHIRVVNDSADMVKSSISSVMSTMALAIIISTVILFLFFGDVKASLIVATSIPISILAALVMMWAMGYSYNVITLGSLVLGVGMMVDNSIVVLEACFRAMDEEFEHGFVNYVKAAVKGVRTVGASVFGSTLTTCVVFLPLGFMSGLSGQFFQPLGMTIVFCIAASLVSAITIVPLCYTYYRPREREKAPAYTFMRNLQAGYRNLMKKILRHRKLTLFVTLLAFIASIAMATDTKVQLMPETDEGTVNITVAMEPGINMERQDETYRKVEEIISSDPDLEDYMLTSSSGTGSITAYLSSDRVKTTDETVEAWKQELQSVADCDITVEAYSTTGILNEGGAFSLSLVSSDYDDLKTVNDDITDGLMLDERVTGVSSTLANSAPLIKIDIDPIKAAAEGLNPAQLSASLYTMMSGSEVDKLDVDGQQLSVIVEYPKDEFDELSEVEDIMLSSSLGTRTALRDVADITFEDSPETIVRSNRQYQVTISADYTELADQGSYAELYTQYVAPNLKEGVEEQESTMTEMMNEEFGSLFTCLLIAVFLVFVVMAAQFESPRFSIMVMATIPFGMIGSFFLLWVMDIPITMVELIGFLMLIGTVVNNGILYVDTVNQYRDAGMDIHTALIEAGATRLRPIMMTTLTTVLSMLPLAVGYGDSGELMQGLSVVNIGGLSAATILALLVLPVAYLILDKRKSRKLTPIDFDKL